MAIETLELNTAEQRAAWLAQRHGVDAPEIKRDEDGEILVSDGLTKFMSIVGVSIDWLVFNDPTDLIDAYERNERSTDEFAKVVKELSPVQRKAISLGMELSIEQDFPIQETMEQITSYLKENKEAA